ncbi:MAG: DNA double-strand break repair nuclease NurA [Candidatus Micrarchaeia archaeon]
MKQRRRYDMLMRTYEYAVENRDKIVKDIDLKASRELIEDAKKIWKNYTPTPKKKNLAGIDSSWNFIPYQGFYLFVVEAVSMLEDCSHTVEPLFEVGLSTLSIEENEEIVYDPRTRLQSLGMEFEYRLAVDSIGKVDYLLVDGSVLARFYDRRRKKPIKFYEYARKLMGEENLAFISKTSSSNTIFGGFLGDMFYFNHASLSTGYSEPYYDNIGVSIFYARLAEGTPCIRIEVPGKLNCSEVEKLLDIFKASSVSGYPYVLRLAHEQCKVSIEDLERLANTLGLNVEIGGREVLGE